MRPFSTRQPRAIALLITLVFGTALYAEDIVDNLANVSDDWITLNSTNLAKGAEAFTTGSEFTTLDSVTVRLENFDAYESTARIELWSGDNGYPETLIETVGTIEEITAIGNYSVDSSAHSLLAPSTLYWIVVVFVEGDFYWMNTLDTGITPASTGTLPGETVVTSGGAAWLEPLAATSQQMKVSASPDAIVTSTADDGSDGTLRKAIADAGEGGGSRILFAPGLNGETIRLNGTQLYVDKPLVIDGSDLPRGITISGDRTGDGESEDDSRVFQINGSVAVTLKSLTISGGRASNSLSGPGGFGGGIKSTFATLTMEQCTIANNRAGDAGDESFSGESEGRYGNEDLYGGDGGGIYNRLGTLILEQCTVANNRAGDGSEGGYGGGIFNESATLIVEQCTIANNRAGDGFDNGDGMDYDYFPEFGEGGGEFDFYFSGFGGNGGGIFTFGETASVSISDSIVAGNLVGTGDTADGEGPDLNSDDNTAAFGINLIGDNTLSSGNASTVFPSGDLVGTFSAPLDVLLGELADNGGPTPTLLPQRQSPAINPVGGLGVSVFSTDQRGFERVVLGIMDVGAVEAPDYAVIDAKIAAEKAAARAAAKRAAVRAARIAEVFRKIAVLKRKAKIARRKGQAAKLKRLEGQIKKLTRQLRAL